MYCGHLRMVEGTKAVYIYHRYSSSSSSSSSSRTNSDRSSGSRVEAGSMVMIAVLE